MIPNDGVPIEYNKKIIETIIDKFGIENYDFDFD